MWYGELPEHWELRSVKSLFHIKKEIAGREGFDVLSITQRGIKVKDVSLNEGQMAQNYAKYQFVNIGDFAMNHMDLLTGWVDCSNYFGVTSPDYRVFTLHDEMQSKSYLLKLLQLCYTQRVFYALGRGAASEGRWRLPRKEFMNFLLPIPPREKQDQIVRYLDWKVSQINKLIHTKQRQVEYVKEKIDVLTNKAIIESRNRLRLKVSVDVIRKWINRNSTTLYRPIGVLNRGRGIFNKDELSGSDLGNSDFFSIEPNFLIFSGQFAWEGAVALTTNAENGCIASHRYYTVRGKEDICETNYLWALFQSSFGDMILNHCSRGAAGRNKPLNFNMLMNEYIPLPSTEMQKLISYNVKLLMQLRKETDIFKRLLAEYRIRLISDIVTGKANVNSSDFARS